MLDDVSEEPDLIELIEIIWNGKWLIGGITGISVILIIAGTMLLPPSFEGQVEVSALDNTQMAAFAPLNNTPGISQPIFSGPELIGYEGVINSTDLYKAFISELRRGRFISEAHAELDQKIINFEGGAIERRDKLLQLRKSYEFSVDKDNPLQGTFHVYSDNKELARAIVANAFEASSDHIRRENLLGISNLQLSIGYSLNYEIDEIETSIANAIANYENETAARLARLTDQAAIARQLGIADNQAGIAARGTNGIGINVNSDLPAYLRGFNALEKEIALINDRGNDILPYITNYPALAAKLRKYKTDKRLERIEKGILLTPLAGGKDFVAVDYDLESMIFESTVPKTLIVVLSTLMSGMLAVIFVLIRHFMARRKLAT